MISIDFSHQTLTMTIVILSGLAQKMDRRASVATDDHQRLADALRSWSSSVDSKETGASFMSLLSSASVGHPQRRLRLPLCAFLSKIEIPKTSKQAFEILEGWRYVGAVQELQLDGERESDIGRLPDEILLKIFSFLDDSNLLRLRRVCRRWSRIGADPSFWSVRCKRRWIPTNSTITWSEVVESHQNSWLQTYLSWDAWDRLVDRQSKVYFDSGDSVFRNLLQISQNPTTLSNRMLTSERSTSPPPRQQIESTDDLAQPRNLSRKYSSERLEKYDRNSIESTSSPTSTTTTTTTTINAGREYSVTISVIQPSDNRPPKIGDIRASDWWLFRSRKLSRDGNDNPIDEDELGFGPLPAPPLPSLNLLLPPLLTRIETPILPSSSSSSSSSNTTLNITNPPAPNTHVTITDEEQKSIASADLWKLVEKLTTLNQVDLEFVKTFNLMLVYFTTPQILLKLLLRRFYVDRPRNGFASTQEENDWTRQYQSVIRLRVINTLKIWIDQYYTDFDSFTIDSLDNWSLTCLNGMRIGEALHRALRTPSSAISRSRGNSCSITYQFSTAAPTPDVPRSIFSISSTIDIWEIPTIEIARQLTLIEFGLFSAIHPREFLSECWGRRESPGLTAILDRFDNVSRCWVPKLLSLQLSNKKIIKNIKKLVTLIGELVRLNNFNTTAAIIHGILVECLPAVERVWDEISVRTKKELRSSCLLLDNDRDYTARLSIRDACIPYLDCYLQRIRKVEQEVSSFTSNNLINFAKFRVIYKLVSELIEFQQTPYNLQPVAQIAALLLNNSEDSI